MVVVKVGGAQSQTIETNNTSNDYRSDWLMQLANSKQTKNTTFVNERMSIFENIQESWIPRQM